MTSVEGSADPEDPNLRIRRWVEVHHAELHSFVDLNMGRWLRSRESASDIVQSTVRQLLSGGAAFEFRGDAQFRAYVCSAALNKVFEKQRHYTAQRRDVRRLQHNGPEADAAIEGTPNPAEHPSPSAVAELRDDQERLRTAFDALNEADRRILTMRRILDMSIDEIAAELDIAPRTVTYRLGNALGRLSKAMGRKSPPPESME